MSRNVVMTSLLVLIAMVIFVAQASAAEFRITIQCEPCESIADLDSKLECEISLRVRSGEVFGNHTVTEEYSSRWCERIRSTTLDFSGMKFKTDEDQVDNEYILKVDWERGLEEHCFRDAGYDVCVFPFWMELEGWETMVSEEQIDITGRSDLRWNEPFDTAARNVYSQATMLRDRLSGLVFTRQ